MSVLQVLNLGSKMYNKGGYRLASIVSLSVPNNARELGVQTIKRATIEHINGEKKFVETWLGKDGRAIKTIHASGANLNERIITDYKWSSPRITKKGDWYDEYLKKDNPYAFENITGKIERSLIIKPQGELKFKELKKTYTNLDINNEHRTVTKSVGEFDEKFSTSEIYSIQNGKKIKGLKLKAQKQQDGTYKTINSDYFGVSKEDANFVFSDEYFHSRFLPTFAMAQNCVAQAAKNQELSYIPKFFKSEYKDCCTAIKDSKGIGLYESILNDTALHADIVDALNHESKHLKQYELVEKYLNGELTDLKDIELAKQYKQNYDNYIPFHQDAKKYRKQLVEQEAYAAGRKVRRLYFDVTDKLRRLFDFSSWHSIGA